MLASAASAFAADSQHLVMTQQDKVESIAFSNKVIITDIDGDQLFFDNEGTGSFHLGIPGADFRGSGGPLQGTYVITGGTGKFSEWEVGKTYTYRAIATNPPVPGALGTVRVQVSTKSK